MRRDKAAVLEVGWRQRRIEGYGTLTGLMYVTLRDMAADTARAWHDLAGLHGSTIKALVGKGYVIGREVGGAKRYTLTHRGKKAVQVFGMPVEGRRRDGICPACGVQPRGQWASGKAKSYCDDCQREGDLKTAKIYGAQRRPDALCPVCRSRPIMRQKNGRFRSMCRECKNARHREYKARKNRELLERIGRGEFVACIRCQQRARYVTANTVHEYCRSCVIAAQKASRKRRGRKEESG